MSFRAMLRGLVYSIGAYIATMWFINKNQIDKRSAMEYTVVFTSVYLTVKMLLAMAIWIIVAFLSYTFLRPDEE